MSGQATDSSTLDPRAELDPIRIKTYFSVHRVTQEHTITYRTTCSRSHEKLNHWKSYWQAYLIREILRNRGFHKLLFQQAQQTKEHELNAFMPYTLISCRVLKGMVHAQR